MAAKKKVILEIDPKALVDVKKATSKKVKNKKPVNITVTKEDEPVRTASIEMNTAESKPRSSVDRGALLLGATLFVIGAVWLLGQILKISFAGYL